MLKLNNIELNLAMNSTDRMDCPKCGGKYCFSVTHEAGHYRWYCFRAQCGFKGRKDYVATTEEIEILLAKKPEGKQEFVVPKSIVYGIYDDRQRQYLRQYGIANAVTYMDKPIGFDVNQFRTVFFLTEGDKTVGAIGRTLVDDHPKVRIYENSKIMPYIHNHYYVKQHIPIIVEDCVSAIKIGVKRHNNAAPFIGFALLGTQFKDEYVPYIKNYKKAFIALDADADHKAVQIRDKLAYIGIEGIIINLEKDIKDMNNEELNELYRELC